MDKEKTILNISQQLECTSEKIAGLAAGMMNDQGVQNALREAYEHLLFDEIAHVQILALELTRIATEGEDEPLKKDDSAFAQGELNSVMGEKESEPDDEKEG